MRSRATLAGVAVVAALLVTAGGAAAAFGGGDAPARTQEQGQLEDTITVGASGQVQAEADRAVVRVAVVTSGDDIETVREQLSSNASQMRGALNEMGVDSSQIRTAHYDISTNRRYRGGESDEPEYRATHAFSITVENTDEVGQVVDTAVTNGANEVDGIEFTLSQDKREDLRQEALRNAMDSARGEAGAIADSADLAVAGVDRVSTTEYHSRPYRLESTGLAASDGGTSINSGPVTVSASVTVVYDVTS